MNNIKAELVKGHKLYFKNATVDDAEFILSLRVDESKSRFLSKTDADLSKQQQWLVRYLQDPMQAYFIIYDSTKRSKIGTVRLYDIQGDSFCWGSWILSKEAPPNSAIESALIVYEYALQLGFKQAHFDVRKKNLSVCRFHERFGAERVAESEEDYFYKIDEAAINNSLNKYKKYLNDGIAVL